MMYKISTQTQNKKRVLGIDPGFARVGIALIDNSSGKDVVVHSECISTPSTLSFEKRLSIIGNSVRDIIKKYNPDAIALETLLWSKNKKTALDVSQARGVIIFVAEEEHIPLIHLHPSEIKIALTGEGNASKEQVEKMVRMLVSLDSKKRIDDEIDAIAIGITGLSFGKIGFPQK